MALFHRAGFQPARTLVLCALVLSSSAPAAADRAVARLEETVSQGLMEELHTWLDENTALPRRHKEPLIRWVDEGPIAPESATRLANRNSKLRGFYDETTRTIWLVRPWSPDDPFNVSVLLHELIHHRQAGHKHWYCPGAQELPAYKLQQAWLDRFGLKANVNWVAVVLEAGCTPKDIHPD